MRMFVNRTLSKMFRNRTPKNVQKYNIFQMFRNRTHKMLSNITFPEMFRNRTFKNSQK